MIETILGAALALILVLYLLDYLGVLDFVRPLVEIFNLLFQGLRWVVSGLARLIRGLVERRR